MWEVTWYFLSEVISQRLRSLISDLWYAVFWSVSSGSSEPTPSHIPSCHNVKLQHKPLDLWIPRPCEGIWVVLTCGLICLKNCYRTCGNQGEPANQRPPADDIRLAENWLDWLKILLFVFGLLRLLKWVSTAFNVLISLHAFVPMPDKGYWA